MYLRLMEFVRRGHTGVATSKCGYHVHMLYHVLIFCSFVKCSKSATRTYWYCKSTVLAFRALLGETEPEVQPSLPIPLCDSCYAAQGRSRNTLSSCRGPVMQLLPMDLRVGRQNSSAACQVESGAVQRWHCSPAWLRGSTCSTQYQA